MEIFKTFYFDAAHDLPFLDRDHKCSNLHGHRFKLTIFVKNDNFKIRDNWVIDFNRLKQIYEQDLKPILDHVYLNEISLDTILDHDDLEKIVSITAFSPTCEVLSVIIWGILKKKVPGLSKIILMETETSGVVYKGELNVS